MKSVLRTGIGIALLVAVVGVAAAVFLAEGALHVPRARYRFPQDAEAVAIARSVNGAWESVSIAAADEAVLQAWWLSPATEPRGAVLLLHGVGDTRRGMAGHAPYLLKSGYAVLLPDSRGHGVSGGDAVTYGVLERRDVHAWAGWLRRKGIERIYGIGVSMGASILLQAMPEAQFRALVAESSFSCFDEIARYRVAQGTGTSPEDTRWFSSPLLATALFYARLRSGIDLAQACPAESIRTDAGRTPLLLIHGLNDRNIPVSHSRRLSAAGSVELWEVPGADHCEALGRNYAEYARRVLAHFAASETQ